ncbi:MAG: DnaJ domain-containing protein [Bdellovibrionaceae bacterium]|nr:DnaJ domain-containing protein [Pseudobdellovibrionaceae bacterium]
MKGKTLVNYYFILNVSPKANTAEIKQAYLKLVRAYHPDKNKGSRLAEKKFQQINFAWEVLKDSNKRKLFDENLKKEKILKESLANQKQIVQKTKKAQTDSTKQTIDLEIPLKISIEDLCRSAIKVIHYLRPINGSKRKNRLEIQIPLGIKPGARLFFKGKGGSKNKIFGNLYVKIFIKPHKIFKILDNSFDIIIEQPISFISAIQSKKVEILSPYGFLALKIQNPLKEGQIFKVKNYGLNKNSKGDKGDLFVKFFIDYPYENETRIQQKMLKMSYEEKKVYIKKMKTDSFIYPKVLRFQKKIQELKKEYYPDE